MYISDIGQLIKDFRSIKLSEANRKFVNDAQARMTSVGSVTAPVAIQLRKLARLYKKQFEELQEARERACRTNGRIASGLSIEEVARRVSERESAKAKPVDRTDLGF